MKTFITDYNLTGPGSAAFDTYFGGLLPCVYDIETSGLSFAADRVILTAMLIPTECGVRVTQFLAEDPYEEDLVLNATLAHIAGQKVDYLVTYNGDSFDVPFTNQRLHAQRLDDKLCLYDLDMYRFFKKQTILPDQLRSLSQKSVEGYFGFATDREDVITGRESVELFREYAMTGNEVIEKVILTHNREDVVQLYKILTAAAFRDFKYVLRDGCDFHNAISCYGFPGLGGKLTVRPTLLKTKLKIRGRQLAAPVSAAAFPENDGDLRIEFIRESASYEAELSVINKSGNAYVDLQSLNHNLKRHITDDSGALPDRITSLDGFVNDYLILSEDGVPKFEEINALADLLVTASYRSLV